MPRLISVIMPIHNGARYLRIALESVLNQTCQDWELIAVDDGSSDETREILDSYTEKDSRIRIYSTEQKGIVSALNTALAHANGDFVARMDCDDICEPTRFEEQLRFLRGRPEYVAVGCEVLLIDDEGDPLGVNDLPVDHLHIVEGLRKGAGGVIRHPTLMTSRELLQLVGGYRPFAQWAEDLDLYFRLARKGRLANLKKVLLRYRVHPESVNFRRAAEQHAVVKEVLACAEVEDGAPTGSYSAPSPNVRAIGLRNWNISWAARAAAYGHLLTARKLLRRASGGPLAEIARLLLNCLLTFGGEAAFARLYRLRRRLLS